MIQRAGKRRPRKSPDSKSSGTRSPEVPRASSVPAAARSASPARSLRRPGRPAPTPAARRSGSGPSARVTRYPPRPGDESRVASGRGAATRSARSEGPTERATASSSVVRVRRSELCRNAANGRSAAPRDREARQRAPGRLVPRPSCARSQPPAPLPRLPRREQARSRRRFRRPRSPVLRRGTLRQRRSRIPLPGNGRRRFGAPLRRATAATRPCRRCCRRGRGTGRPLPRRRGRRPAGPPGASRPVPRARTPSPRLRGRGGGRCRAGLPLSSPGGTGDPRGRGRRSGAGRARALRHPREDSRGESRGSPSARRCRPSSARRSREGPLAPERRRIRGPVRGERPRGGGRRRLPGARRHARPSLPAGRRSSCRLYWFPSPARGPAPKKRNARAFGPGDS